MPLIVPKSGRFPWKQGLYDTTSDAIKNNLLPNGVILITLIEVKRKSVVLFTLNRVENPVFIVHFYILSAYSLKI